MFFSAFGVLVFVVSGFGYHGLRASWGVGVKVESGAAGGLGLCWGSWVYAERLQRVEDFQDMGVP